jgi:DNA adenine methylase
MSEIASPFLKSVGGKRQLLSEIRKHVPERFGRYLEPFLGGGAVFFDLVAAGRLNRSAWLGDSNRSLVTAYDVIQNNVDALIKELHRHACDHSEAHYYAVRKECPTISVDSAARTIYLNKTCFNGLYRVNKSGQFNVPMGRYANPTVCDEPNLRAVSASLRLAELHADDFESAETAATANDFVYLDCPYWPASATSNFTGYTKDGFTAIDQQRLRDAALRMKRRGVHVLLSNADVPPVRDLYASGFEMRRVEATRAINSKPGKRGAVGELLIW